MSENKSKDTRKPAPLTLAQVKQWEEEARQDLPSELGSDFDESEVMLAVARRAFELAAAQQIALPQGLHPRTADLVTRFAAALAEKLYASEVKRGYSDGWASPDWLDECRAELVRHVAKGDPRDVAAYCAFLWHHGANTELAAQAKQGDA